jgi:hypothetical protein
MSPPLDDRKFEKNMLRETHSSRDLPNFTPPKHAGHLDCNIQSHREGATVKDIWSDTEVTNGDAAEDGCFDAGGWSNSGTWVREREDGCFDDSCSGVTVVDSELLEESTDGEYGDISQRVDRSADASCLIHRRAASTAESTFFSTDIRKLSYH